MDRTSSPGRVSDGPGSCYDALKLVPDCLDARVTGHPQPIWGMVRPAVGVGQVTVL